MGKREWEEYQGAERAAQKAKRELDKDPENKELQRKKGNADFEADKAFVRELNSIYGKKKRG